ncbi:uncharacterized protein LOC109888182 [Oncorhynchus kisutch]|uniref:Uncharacterized LOC109888182 n=1 Tax=Oncorhynchus kisutch TaxID=8019 RepID=A0A8C7CTI4_ONCKI|nr:uncharacterized protein LOC109888182 [Oncorhynchus kisutch]
MCRTTVSIGSDMAQENPIQESFTPMDTRVISVRRCLMLGLLHRAVSTTSPRGTSASLMPGLNTVLWPCRKILFWNKTKLDIEGLTPVVSASPPPSVVAQPGDNVTFHCTGVTGAPGHVGWFKQDNGSEPLCIASMYSSEPTVQHHNGFQPSHMEMFISHRKIFLKITEVDVADSGVYFCGMFDKHIIFTNATVLKVQDHKDSEKDQTEHCEEVADPQMRILVLLSIIRTGVLLCCLTIFIIIYTTRK